MTEALCFCYFFPQFWIRQRESMLRNNFENGFARFGVDLRNIRCTSARARVSRLTREKGTRRDRAAEKGNSRDQQRARRVRTRASTTHDSRMQALVFASSFFSWCIFLWSHVVVKGHAHRSRYESEACFVPSSFLLWDYCLCRRLRGTYRADVRWRWDGRNKEGTEKSCRDENEAIMREK